MKDIRRKPVVFVSSTCYDLKQVREDLKDYFEENYGFTTMLSEFDSFPINPCKGTFENCIENVDKLADIFVLIIGNRYGYITESGKSITNLEYLHAKEKGIPIYVFVDKQLYDSMKIWRSNKDADFSKVVDSIKLFEFVSGIYDESKQWIYTYESVRDVKMVLKQQLSLIFNDGLILQKIMSDSYNRILNADIPSNAIRVYIEKPYAWEYKFLACVLKGEFEKLQSHRWDFKFGVYSAHTICLKRLELIDDISEKLNAIRDLSMMFSNLLNCALQEAIGDPGVPSNLDMIIYVSKQLASVYKRMIEWGLYFRSIHTEDAFANLLALLCEQSRYLMEQIDEFVEKVFSEITDLPDVEDGVKRKLSLNCVLDVGNMEQIDKEIERLIHVFTCN